MEGKGTATMIPLLVCAVVASQSLPPSDPVSEALREGMRLRVFRECDSTPREQWTEWCRFADRFRRIERPVR